MLVGFYYFSSTHLIFDLVAGLQVFWKQPWRPIFIFHSSITGISNIAYHIWYFGPKSSTEKMWKRARWGECEIAQHVLSNTTWCLSVCLAAPYCVCFQWPRHHGGPGLCLRDGQTDWWHRQKILYSMVKCEYTFVFVANNQHGWNKPILNKKRTFYLLYCFFNTCLLYFWETWWINLETLH